MHKILIANRGEIAVRIIRACRDMGIASVAVYSDCDRAARHVRMADEAVAVGPSAPAESYLHIGKLVDAALAAGADAVHPGYGFLAENAGFAAACRDAGLIFIGPTPEVIARMGNKARARAAAVAAGVAVVPGADEVFGPQAAEADVADAAARLGYPVMVKAVAGGGGKGMRVVAGASQLAAALRAARSEAVSAFGDGAVYLERRLERPRHIEVQLLADHYGTVLPCVERECSIQRRHQKVVEESPSLAVSPELRARLARAAAAVAASVQYTNAGTVEFLLDPGGAFYFLEMNTRLQVEHPVTEMVTGIDLVHWQIRIARGERLDLDPDVLMQPRGHAIECRIYAEDPEAGFLPSPGHISWLRAPAGPGIRDDGGVEAGAEIPVHYDALMSKLVAWGADRPQAIARMSRALREYDVLGVRTTVPLFKWLLTQPTFLGADVHTGYLDGLLQSRPHEPFVAPDTSHAEVAAIVAALDAAGVSDVAPTGTERAGAGERRSRWTAARAAAQLPPRPYPRRESWTERARLEGLRG